jgi:hypothetical protein
LSFWRDIGERAALVCERKAAGYEEISKLDLTKKLQTLCLSNLKEVATAQCGLPPHAQF